MEAIRLRDTRSVLYFHVSVVQLYIFPMNWNLIFLAAGLTFVCVGAGIWPLIMYLRHRSILDHPNDRSSHEIPTPKGAGLVMIPVLACAWVIIGNIHGDPPVRETIGIAGLAVFLALISWIDDLRHVPAVIRLFTHIIAASVAVEMMPDNVLFFHGLFPEQTDAIATVILLVWFINAFNFMDGIDGISGVTTLAIGLGVLLTAGIVVPEAGLAPFAGALIGAAIGFLIWNWHPAKIFLGDVGSAPLGLLIGWMLLSINLEGLWAAALILPGYYMADAGITLLIRIYKGKRVWEAHKEHFFQRAVHSGMSHARTTLIIFVMNLILVGGAYAAVKGFTLTSLGICISLVLALLYFFFRSDNASMRKTK